MENDIKDKINAALTDDKADFFTQFEQATGYSSFEEMQAAKQAEQDRLLGLIDEKTNEAIGYKQRFERVSVANAILTHATDAIEPSIIVSMLAGKAHCDDDGYVTIGGKPVADAVKTLLAEKPFLVNPAGSRQRTTDNKQMTRDAFGKLSPEKKMSFIKAKGVVVD